MISYYSIAGLTLASMFICFLVLSKTVNGILNELLKIEYMLQKELEYKKEEIEVKNMIEDSLADMGTIEN